MAEPAKQTAPQISAADARAIAKEAYTYGFPIVDSYRIQYSYFVDAKDPEYKGTWNKVFNTARVYTPDDKAIQTPNSDTPYSFIGADLRAEPLVISVPDVDKGRFYHGQFIDMYTHNFAYVGTRTTGNGKGDFLLAGPDWKGERPEGMRVIRCETQFCFVLFRTQLMGPDDIGNVKKIQAGYKVQPLSQFTGQPAPKQPPAVAFIKPLSVKEEEASLDVFRELNFLLQFCPPHPSEKELMARFAQLGIGAGMPFDAKTLSPELQKAVQDGIADAWKAFEEVHQRMATGQPSSIDLFGTRQYLKNNYLYRMTAAKLGIYGNSKEEAYYPSYTVDADRKPMDGSHRYELRFEPGKFPPVEAFWSLTMYRMPESLLYANPIDRYLINSPMLPNLKKDADGGLTIYVQHDSPGKEKEANWLPAPEGPFVCAMRLYGPKPEAYDGSWKNPPMKRVD